MVVYERPSNLHRIKVSRILTIKDFALCKQRLRREKIIRSGVQQTGISRHLGPNWGFPETSRTSQHYGIEGIKGGPQLGPHHAESRIFFFQFRCSDPQLRMQETWMHFPIVFLFIFHLGQHCLNDPTTNIFNDRFYPHKVHCLSSSWMINLGSAGVS